MEWIKIEQGLPKIGIDVLVLVQKKNKKLKPAEMRIRVGHRLSDRDIWIIGDNFGFDLGKVSHWMPLPEYPSE
jgi:hypothetical protein